jgi:hypothetical protein
MNVRRLAVPSFAAFVLSACGGAPDPTGTSSAADGTDSKSPELHLFCPVGTNPVCTTPTSCKCVVDAYVDIAGTVTGLSGAGLTLINAGVEVAVNQNGPIWMTGKVSQLYDIEVSSEPAGQACVVTNGTGYATSAGGGPFTVTCGAAFTVGGTITGLTPTNPAGELSLLLSVPAVYDPPQSETSNGAFTFSQTVANGQSYQVEVYTMPPGQNCTVANATGTINGASVDNVVVSCSACGGDEQPACPVAASCLPGYTVNPVRGVCVPCGQPGLLACGGTTCSSGALVGQRCMAQGATKLPELVVMCEASDYASVVVDPQTGAQLPMATSPLTKQIPEFFTPSGSGTDNLFDYFTEMTYGRIDRSGTVVVPWTAVNLTQAQLGALGRTGRTQACVAAAKAANPSLDTSAFVDFVSVFNCQMDGGNQGNDVSTDPYGLFTNFMAQEVTHSLGQHLHTERQGCVDSSGNPQPYCDPWDEMSAARNYDSPSTIWWAPSNFGGPAAATANSLVAANRIIVAGDQKVTILEPSEIYTAAPGQTTTVTLSAVNRDELTGIRVIEIPGGGVYYTVELMRNTGWDSHDPETAILVHSVQTDGQVTLIGKAISGDGSYTSGDVISLGNATVTIGTIDLATSSVSVTVAD